MWREKMVTQEEDGLIQEYLLAKYQRFWVLAQNKGSL